MTKRRKYHKPEQIIKKLREAETMLAAGKTIGQVYQTLEVSEQAYERWKKKYGVFDGNELAVRVKLVVFYPAPK
jgi:putative transposase